VGGETGSILVSESGVNFALFKPKDFTAIDSLDREPIVIA
jgi:tRNA A58 N-methylase Trm61